MKKFILAILFCFLSIFTFANDWEFGSEGEHIIPLKGSNMSIKKEKITLKLTSDGMLVNVKFTFDNPTAENKIVGFVTPESGNGEEEDETTKPKRKAEPLKIKNFKTTVNGKEVKSNVELLSKLLSKGVLDNNIIKEYTEKEKNFYNYVYYFNADFKQGENVVEHSYFYTGSYGIYQRDFSYVVTTISKWKNKTVEDFEIEVYPGNYFVQLPYSFWKNTKKINWEIVGKGRMVTIDPTKPNDKDADGIEKFGTIYLKLDNGFVRYKTKNFSPNEDFYMTRMDNILGFEYQFPEGKVQGYKFKDKYFEILREVTYSDYSEIINSLKDLSDEDLDIVRNYPYAFAGYDFARKDLKDYFSQFIWYNPIGKNIKIDPNFNNIIKAVDEIKTKRKK